ncbi:hypothetical protein JCM10212_003090 [Sporobolomyces blumeae]
MSASIAGSTFFTSGSVRRPASTAATRTSSAPSLHTAAASISPDAPPMAPSPLSLPGTSGTTNPYLNHPYPQMAHHLASSTVVQPLQPLTPIQSPGSPPVSGNQSVLSFASTSSASSTTGVSRASSCRSTSSVQAVPIKKPQRGPAVPRIVTRGLSAIGAYGVGLSSPTSTSQSNSTLGGGGGGFTPASGSSAMSNTPPGSSRTERQARPQAHPRQLSNSSTGSNRGPPRGTSRSPQASPRIAPPTSPRPLDSPFYPPPPPGDGSSTPPPLATPPRFLQHRSASACSPVEEGSSAGSDSEGWRVRGRRALSAGAKTIKEVSTSSLMGGGGGGGGHRTNASAASSGQNQPSSASSLVGALDRGSRGGGFRDRVSSSSSSNAAASSRRAEVDGGAASPAPSSLSAGGVGGGGAGGGGGTRPRESSATSMGTVTSSQGTSASATAGTSVSSSHVNGNGPQASHNAAPNSMGVVGSKRTVEDFEFGEVLGEGSYSTVTLVRTVHPPYREYALKVLDKEHIRREKKTKYVLIERDTLKQLDGHPGVVRLYWTFQDEWSLYYVLELAPNGELLKWIKKYGSFDLRSARYYAAQILSAVGFMHTKGVIHRDLKPENVLFAEDMRIKITDFGTAKLLNKEELIDGRPQEDPTGRARTRSFVGTPEYVSPEVLSEGRESSFSSDFWALGCIIFQMLAGRPPFQARTEYLMFQKIINLEFEFPLGFPPEAKDLVEKLLVVDPTKRLGGDPKNGNGIDAIKSHPFFTSHLKNPSGAFPLMTTKIPASGLPESAFDESDSEAEEELFPEAPAVLSDGALSPPERTVIDVPNGSPASFPVNPDSAPPSIPSQSPADSPVLPIAEHPLDAPIDFSTIWTIEPPEIRTGLSQPVPVHKGEFVLDLGTGSGAASSFGTGEFGDEGEAWEGEEEGEAQASVSDEEYGPEDETCSSPTSTSARELPSFGGGKWANVLLPSETILLTSPILQRPSSAAAARSALLRSSKIKFPSKVPSSLNPLNLITSSASVANASSATGHQASGGPAPPTVAAPPLPAGTKERTLILTDYPRLLCIKETPKKVRVKNEVFLGSALRGGIRREGVSAFIAAEEIGNDGKGFVVKTSQRNYKYDEPSGQATRWIQELREAHAAGLTNAPRR